MIDPASTVERGTEIDMVRIMQMIPHRHPFLMID
ncbi:MAG: 3-hydroxyacyl-[acyl-carrier-protein] dehydratase FabZ, partial [Alphaproteobacteria bacterium]|nr:3-hydroxyacyl-[acyl-carrier-protein] dehydratase FabZ [Alphaproteobacteria bacterium]